MKLDLKIRCALSFHVRLKDEAPEIAIDTHEKEGTDEWCDGQACEDATLLVSPAEDLYEGQLLIVARGVSIELDVDELLTALNVLKAARGHI